MKALLRLLVVVSLLGLSSLPSQADESPKEESKRQIKVRKVAKVTPGKAHKGKGKVIKSSPKPPDIYMHNPRGGSHKEQK